MGATGLEQAAGMPANQGGSETGGAKSGASGAVFDPADPDVADLARRLAVLPEAVRASLLAAVKAAAETAAK